MQFSQDVSLLFISVFASCSSLGLDVAIRMRRRTPRLPLASVQIMDMAELHKRQRKLGGTNSSPEGSASGDRGDTGGESSTVFMKLLAAGLYGVSSFLIVVVNKSVLSSYR